VKTRRYKKGKKGISWTGEKGQLQAVAEMEDNRIRYVQLDETLIQLKAIR